MSQTYTYKANKLSLWLMLADVVVIANPDPAIKIVASGDEEICQKILVNKLDNILRVIFPIPLIDGRLLTIGGVTGSRDLLYIDGHQIDQSRKIKLTIYIPDNLDLTVDRVLGDVCTLGNVGNLNVFGGTNFCLMSESASGCTINTTGGYETFISSVQNKLQIEIQGKSSVIIEHAQCNEAKVKVTSKSSVSLIKGLVSQLNVNVSAGGTFLFQGTAVNADLSGTNDGSTISLKHCVNEPTINSSGAKIVVGGR